jgi:hypothetical protein
MKQIIYGIYAEDDANKLFIINVIGQLLNHFECAEKITLIHQEDFTKIAVAKSSDFVLETYLDRVTHGIRYYGLALCFVCLDCEDRNFEATTAKMQRGLAHHTLENRVIISLPVQSIEYWLWYLNEKQQNAAISTIAPIETLHTRAEVKKMVYGSKRATNKVSNPIVEQLAQNIDFHWLNAHSESFECFYNNFKQYLEKN